MGSTHRRGFLGEFSVQSVCEALNECVSSSHDHTAIQTLKYKSKVLGFIRCWSYCAYQYTASYQTYEENFEIHMYFREYRHCLNQPRLNLLQTVISCISTFCWHRSKQCRKLQVSLNFTSHDSSTFLTRKSQIQQSGATHLYLFIPIGKNQLNSDFSHTQKKICLKHLDNYRSDVNVAHSHAGRHHMADSQHGVSRQALKVVATNKHFQNENMTKLACQVILAALSPP